jgi:hypothetical protein
MEFCQKATLIFKKLAKSPFFTLKQVAKNFTHFKSLFFGGECHHRSVYWLLLSPLSPQFGKKSSTEAYTPVTKCFFFRRIFTKF